MSHLSKPTESPSSRALIDDLAVEAPRLVGLLRRAVRRSGWLALIDGAMWGLLLGLVSALLFIVYEKLFWPGWDSAWSWSIAGGSLASGLVLGALVGWLFRSRDPVRAALAIEGEYALQERLSSLVFLRRSNEPALAKDGDDYATRVDLTRAIPFRRPRALVPVFCMAIALVVAVFVPQLDLLRAEEDRQEVAKEEKRVQEARKRQEKRLKKLEELAKKNRVSPKTQKLLQKMRQRAPERRKKADRKAAKGEIKRRELADMEDMRREAKELRNRADMKQLDQFLNKVQSAGQKMQSQEGKQLAKAMQQGDLSQASDALRRLAKKMQQLEKQGGKNGEDFKELEKDLERIMKKMEGAPKMGALSEALADLSSMSASELSKAMNDAAQQMDQLDRLMRERDILDSALDDIELTREELAALPAEWPEPCELCKAGGT